MVRQKLIKKSAEAFSLGPQIIQSVT